MTLHGYAIAMSKGNHSVYWREQSGYNRGHIFIVNIIEATFFAAECDAQTKLNALKKQILYGEFKLVKMIYP